MSRKIIVINGVEYVLYGWSEDTSSGKKEPHIAEAETGRIPVGQQRNLLKEFLVANGVNIEPWSEKTTHWCVLEAMKLISTAVVSTVSATNCIESHTDYLELAAKNIEVKKSLASTFLQITEANIEEQDRLVQASDDYGKENRIIHDVLNAYPRNNDLNIIAIKIALIDVTNSTHLSQYKSQISLYDLANVILNIKDFDRRLANGDLELVNIIAKNKGAINLFSFASKYCTYHNVEVYGRDDYSIFDGIVQKTLPHYIEGLSAYKIDCWRTSYDYVAFNNCIGALLDKHKIHIPFRRRKFDHFLWYANR